MRGRAHLGRRQPIAPHLSRPFQTIYFAGINGTAAWIAPAHAFAAVGTVVIPPVTGTAAWRAAAHRFSATGSTLLISGTGDWTAAAHRFSARGGSYRTDNPLVTTLLPNASRATRLDAHDGLTRLVRYSRVTPLRPKRSPS